MPLTATQQYFTKLYLASFLRPPELGGLNYWVSEVNSGKSLQQVGGIIFSLSVVTAIYPQNLSDNQFVEAIYQNVFGRASDAGGLNYWSSEIAVLRSDFLAQGSAPDFAAFEARGQLVMNMINAGLGTPDGTDGKAYIKNRLEVAEFAVEQQLAQGKDIPVQMLLDIFVDVGASDSSVPHGECEVASFFDETAPTQGAIITSALDDAGSVVGLIADNGITDDTTPLLGGTLTAPLGLCETLAVSRDGVVIGNAVVTGTNWSYADSGLSHGLHTYSARVVDLAGNQGAASPIYRISVDTTPPPVDTTPPVLRGAEVNGATLTLSYNEGLNGVSDAAASAFVVSVDGIPVAVSSVNAGGTAVVLSLATPVLFGQTVTVSYTPPATSPTEDQAGNDAAAISAQAVSNTTPFVDITPPSVGSIAISSAVGAQANTLNAGDVVSVAVSMSEATIVTGSPQLAVNIGGVAVQANYASGSGSTVLVFDYTILAAQTDANGISIDANSLSLNGGSLQDATGNNVTLTHAAVTDNAGFKVDTSAPTLSSAEINGNTLTLTYNEPLSAASNAVPSAFVVNVNGSPAAINSVDSNGAIVTLSLGAAISYDQIVTLDYVRPASSPIEDLAGNRAADLTSTPVTNLSPQPDPRSGMLITDFAGSNDAGYSLGLQSDGKIVVAGYADNGNSDFALARYNTDGSLDASFNGDGKLTTNFLIASSVGSSDAAYSLSMLSDGKMLLGGYVYNGNNGYNFALAKYNSNGSLDTSFDTDGKLVTDIAGSTGADDKGYSVAVDANGKILLAGYSNVSGNYNFSLVRYNANGSLDAGFDVDGKLTTDIFSGSFDEGHGLALQADGKIVLAGFAYSASNSYDFALVRYNTDGSLDNSFDADGKLTTDFAGNIDYGYSVTVQANQKILVSGYTYSGDSGYDFALARYNSDGSLDTGFGIGGKLVTDVSASQDFANKVIVQADGKIIVAGSSFNAGSIDFSLVRYLANGNIDTSFGSNGKVLTDFAATQEYGYDVVIDANGKIVVSGYSFNGSHNDFALARYNDDGSLESGNFGQYFLASGDNAESLRFTGAATDSDTVNAYFGKSTQAHLDSLQGFALGADHIHLANASALPSSLVRVADIASSDDLANSLNSSFSGSVGASAAAIVIIQSGTAAGTYLYANDGNAAYSTLDDVFVQLVGIQGALGGVGALTVSDIFI